MHDLESINCPNHPRRRGCLLGLGYRWLRQPTAVSTFIARTLTATWAKADRFLRAWIGRQPCSAYHPNEAIGSECHERPSWGGCHPSQRGRVGLCLDAPRCIGAHRHCRWHRHVGGRGRSACGRSRIRCRSRGRVAALHHHALGLCNGWNLHGAARRPVRHCPSGCRRSSPPQHRLHPHQSSREPVAVRHYSRAAHWHWQLGELWTALGRHLALVHPSSWYRGSDLRQRQLSRWHDLAAAYPALRGDLWLARDVFRHRCALSGDSVAARFRAAPSTTASADFGGGAGGRRLSSQTRDLAQHAPRPARRSWRRLLRGHVHAAGAHRRLLWRPRLWRSAWRRDALLDAGLRHRQPPHFRMDRGSNRRPRDASARVDAAGDCAVPLSAIHQFAVALSDLCAVRPFPGRDRAELRHRRARVLRTWRGRNTGRRRPDGNSLRHGARGLAVWRAL